VQDRRDCQVFNDLDSSIHGLLLSRRKAPEPCISLVRPRTEGAGKAGAKIAPIALRAKRKDTQASVLTGTPFAIGLPSANGFNGFLRALPGEPGFLATITGG
jgi:hypothetical protein